jgi:hypothetical protein
VSVLVPFAQTSDASVPKVVRLRVPADQTLAGIPVTDEAIVVSIVPIEEEAISVCAFTSETIDVEALVTRAFVPALPAAKPAAREVDAVSVCAFTAEVTPAVAVLVFPFTTAATELEALCTSESVARDPVESPASVRVLVPLPHTSEASVPNEVNVRVPAAHTFVGIEVIALERVESVDASDAVCVFVFPFTTAAIDDEAVSVCAFTALVIPAVAVLVFPFTTAAIDDEAVVTTEDVFAFTIAAMEEDAV